MASASARGRRVLSVCLEVRIPTLSDKRCSDRQPLPRTQGQGDASEVRLTETHCGMSEPTENVPPVHYL